MQFLFCTIRPTCCYLIERVSIQVGGILVREVESGRAAQSSMASLCHPAGSLKDLWESLCSCMLFATSRGFLSEIILEWHWPCFAKDEKVFQRWTGRKAFIGEGSSLRDSTVADRRFNAGSQCCFALWGGEVHSHSAVWVGCQERCWQVLCVSGLQTA